jgi:hypothetical protein
MFDSLIVTPIALQLNYYLMQYVLSWSRIFSQLSEEKREETLARLNGILVNSTIIIAWFFVNTPEDMIYMSRLFAGYLIYDIPYAKDFSMVFHHLFSIALHFYTKEMSGPDEIRQLCNIAASLESSALFISLSWLSSVANHRNVYLRTFTFVFWTIMRLGVFPYIVYGGDSQVFKIIFTPLAALNVYWFTMLVKHVRAT